MPFTERVSKEKSQCMQITNEKYRVDRDEGAGKFY